MRASRERQEALISSPHSHFSNGYIGEAYVRSAAVVDEKTPKALDYAAINSTSLSLSLPLSQSAVTLCARICFSLLPDLFESMLSFALFMRYMPAPRGHMLWEGGRIREGLCMRFPIPVSSSLCPLSTFFWVIVPSSLSSFDSRFCDPPSCGGGGRRRRSLSAPTHRLGASLFALCVSFVNSLEGQCRDISKTALPASSLPGGSA